MFGCSGELKPRDRRMSEKGRATISSSVNGTSMTSSAPRSKALSLMEVSRLRVNASSAIPPFDMPPPSSSMKF